jgi:hypothetical protein
LPYSDPEQQRQAMREIQRKYREKKKTELASKAKKIRRRKKAERDKLVDEIHKGVAKERDPNGTFHKLLSILSHERVQLLHEPVFSRRYKTDAIPELNLDLTLMGRGPDTELLFHNIDVNWTEKDKKQQSNIFTASYLGKTLNFARPSNLGIKVNVGQLNKEILEKHLHSIPEFQKLTPEEQQKIDDLILTLLDRFDKIMLLKSEEAEQFLKLRFCQIANQLLKEQNEEQRSKQKQIPLAIKPLSNEKKKS